MADRLCVVLVCNYEGDNEKVFAPLLALQDHLESRGARTFLAFPTQVSHREWYTKLCLSGRGMETFQNGDDEQTVLSLKALYERKKPTALCSANLSPYLVEKAAVSHPETHTFIFLERTKDAIGKKLPKIISRFYDYLIFHYYGKKVHFISQSDHFVKERPLNHLCIPVPIPSDAQPLSRETVEKFREDKGVKNSEILIGSSASLNPERGMIYAVEAVNKLVSALSLPVKLLLYCRPNCKQEDVRKYLCENGVRTENLLFCDAYSSYELSSVCDIYLSPCLKDAFPSYPLEMLSMGKRAVVSSIPGTEFLSKFTTVSTFEAGSVDDCARALLSSIRSAAMPNAAIAAYIRKNFNEEEWIAAMRRVLLFV